MAIAKPEHKFRVRALAEKNLPLITVDEAHLVFDWENFQPAFKDLQNLKFDFPSDVCNGNSNPRY